MRSRSKAGKINAYVLGFIIWAGFMYELSTIGSGLFGIGLGASMILGAILLPDEL
jgi:hypothetical protein